MKHELHIKHYARYTDDFVVIDTDPRVLASLLPKIHHFLRQQLKLELHPNKVEILRYSKGIDFLGYVAFPRFRLLRKHTERRMHRKLRHVIEEYKQGLVTRARTEATLNSYLGILSHADTFKLGEKLKNDFWIQMNS